LRSLVRLIKLLADAADVYDRNPIYTDDYAIDCGFFTIFVGDLREARQLMAAMTLLLGIGKT
jgi:hypothetical protein